ncbi:hypothetical protein BC567DRAFT_293461 [Phyllosticta citribraziliensis]
MQRSSHSNAGATASDHQTQSKSGSPRRVNFDLTPNDGRNWHQNATSPLISPRKGPPSIPYCDLATPLLSKRENGLDDSSRSSSPSHSRLRWAELRSIARNSLATWESSRKGASSSTPRPASPQKSQSPGPKSPLKPCLKSPTSPTFAPQLPPPAPVPPPPRTPRRTAWRSQVAPSLPTLVEVSSAASGAKSDSASRASKSSKSNQSNRNNRPRAAAGRALRHEKYEMERKKRIREYGSKVSQTSRASKSRPQGESPRPIKQEQGKRVSRHEENDSELSNTSKSSRNSRSSRVIKTKEANKKSPPRPPLTRRDAILEAMRVEDPPAPPLASSSVYSSSECSSPTIYSSSSIYSTDTATPTSPATSTERSSPPSTPLSKRTASTSPTSYTASGSDTESFPKTPQTPTSPTKTATSATVTEFDSEADTARTETVDTASSTHRTVSSVALGSALGLKRPSSAVRSVLGLQESQVSAAQEPLVPEPEPRRRRKKTEPRTEETEKNRKNENDGGGPTADLPKTKPQPRVRKRKQARFPETAETPAKDLKKTTSDSGERHSKPSIRGGADEQRPKRERKDGGRKREAQKAPASVDKENKTPEVGDGAVVEDDKTPRRHVSHSIKSRRSVCVRGQGMNLFIDMAHAKPSTCSSSPTFASTAPSTPPTSLHPGVDLTRNPTKPKNLAFRNPFAQPPPPQCGMRYTRPVRRAYAWPRLDRGFDGVGRPPLDLGKALPPIPRGADSGCESDEDGAFGAAVGARARTRPQSSQQRSSAKQKDDGKPHPHPRRLSLSLSALPDTPFLGALDVIDDYNSDGNGGGGGHGVGAVEVV